MPSAHKLWTGIQFGTGGIGLLGRQRGDGCPRVNVVHDLLSRLPILAPTITLPVPYSSAEHARRLKVHAQTWLGDETHSPIVSTDVLDRLNRQFDVLIPALAGNNKTAARAAVIEMFKEGFGHHRGLNHHKLNEDDEDQDAEALPHKIKAHAGAQQEPPRKPLTIHRVPARALAFNLVYLLTRMEIGR